MQPSGTLEDKNMFGEFEPLEVLVEYDGPRTFTLRDSKGELYLAHWLQEDRESAQFLVVPITDEKLARLKHGKLMVLDALNQSRAYCVGVEHAGPVRSIRPTTVNELSGEVLPKPGTPLYSPPRTRKPGPVEIPAPVFSKGDSVVLRSTREQGRIVEEALRSQGEYWYRIQFGKRSERVMEDDLETLDDLDNSLQALALNGRWGRIQAFRCALAVERMTLENRATVYSYKAQRILFEPHQYKPLLKILDSPDRRLLIADEVGLGKTIEAGLILAELEARKPLERVLVVCPPRLRDKWREELNRKFDQPFEIYDKASLNRYIDRAVDNARHGRLRGVASLNTLRAEFVRERLIAELGHIDMVIFDEAHHARNPGTLTSTLLRELCEIADCVLLLTATPIQLKSRDLFTLLEALRPTEFRDAGAFERQLKQFAAIHDAGRFIRSQRAENLELAAHTLELVFDNSAMFTQRDQFTNQVIADLRGRKPNDRREWVELERRVQELHPLSSILTRTRKRDVQTKAPLRKPAVLKCHWTEAESQAYERLVGASGWFDQPCGLGTIQRSRQAASCLPAALEAASNAVASNEEEAQEQTDVFWNGAPHAKAIPTSNLPKVTNLPDSKFDLLRRVLAEVWRNDPGAKVIVFTFFVGTSRYLVRRLEAEGVKALRIAGDVPSHPNDRQRDVRGTVIRQFKSDPAALVLVSTEVGSEGLDFQFCHHLVNYDLPWNPMVVEQRIGRIDRFGQKSDVVYVHNVVVEGTVEERILHRLYDRIGIFRESIGDLEEILGETMSELLRDYFSGKLTPAEADRRVEEAQQAINRRKMYLDQLEKNAGELFGHEEYIRDELNRVGRLGRYLSEKSLLAVLSAYLDAHHPDTGPWPERGRPGIFGIRWTDELRQDVAEASLDTGPYWSDRGDYLYFTTQGDIAFNNPDVALINVSHPLMKAALAQVKKQIEGPLARVGQAHLVIEGTDKNEFRSGLYFVAVFKQIVEGIRPRRLFETVVWCDVANTMLEAESGERLLHLILELGEEWREQDSASPIPSHAWESMEMEILARSKALRERETAENDALYHRRKRALAAEYEMERAVKQQRLATAKANNKESMLPAFHGQLNKLEAEFRIRLRELEESRTARVRLVDEPLAICAVLVKDRN